MNSIADLRIFLPRRFREALLLGLLLLLLAIPLAALVYRSTLFDQINYNEGWNAYYTSLLTQGRPLYYPPQALLTNNYPPLSFLVVAPLARLVGDALFAGRIVAWLAFALLSLTILALLRRIDGDWLAATFGASVFVSYMVVNYDIYVGMDDPQMLAHALILLGLYTYLRHERAAWAAIAAAALMSAGLFAKHNIIALPVALAGWLAIYDRRAGLRFVVTGILCGAAGIVASVGAFGPEFLTSLRMSRPYSAVRAWRHAIEWTVPMQAPLALSLFAVAPGVRDRHGVLFATYILVTLGLGYAVAGGDGTNFNLLFDAVIGGALGAGHLLARLESLAPRLRLWVIAAFAASTCLGAGLVGKKEAFLIRPWIADQHRLEASTLKAVELVAAQPGPALCEPLSICYWAGKSFDFDPLNFAFGVAAGDKDLAAELHRIATGYYGVIVVNPPESVNHFLPPQLVDEVRSHYRFAGAPHGEVYIRP